MTSNVGTFGSGSASGGSVSITGNSAADVWFDDHIKDPEVKIKFMEIPQYRRKTIVLKSMERPPENPESWMVACARNYKTSELEKRVAGGASVYGRGGYQQHGPPLTPGSYTHLTLPTKRMRETQVDSEPMNKNDSTT